MALLKGCRGVYVAVLAMFFQCLWIGRSCAAGFELESVGARGGVSDNANFTQVESLLDWNLPWRWDFISEWHFQTKLDSSLGWLQAESRSAVIGAAGPGALLKYDRVPVSLEGSFCPTFMSRSTFGAKDLGSVVQFTTGVGLNLDIAKHIRIGYRFSHMSNAGIDSKHNDGLNLHMVALSYVF
jgi:hypothetical protein